jgi:hypothetical protein
MKHILPTDKPETIADKIKFQMEIVAMDFENQVETSMKVFHKVLENLLFEAEKEQDKNKYSEEDLKEAFKDSRQAFIFEKDMPCVFDSFEEWFEQFKKK